MTQSSLAFAVDVAMIPRCPIPGIPLSVQTKFRETCKVRFGRSRMSGPQKDHRNVVMVPETTAVQPEMAVRQL